MEILQFQALIYAKNFQSWVLARWDGQTPLKDSLANMLPTFVETSQIEVACTIKNLKGYYHFVCAGLDGKIGNDDDIKVPLFDEASLKAELRKASQEEFEKMSFWEALKFAFRKLG